VFGRNQRLDRPEMSVGESGHEAGDASRALRARPRRGLGCMGHNTSQPGLSYCGKPLHTAPPAEKPTGFGVGGATARTRPDQSCWEDGGRSRCSSRRDYETGEAPGFGQGASAAGRIAAAAPKTKKTRHLHRDRVFGLWFVTIAGRWARQWLRPINPRFRCGGHGNQQRGRLRPRPVPISRRIPLGGAGLRATGRGPSGRSRAFSPSGSEARRASATRGPTRWG